MRSLDNMKLLDTTGGGFSFGAWLGIGGLAVFLAGVLDGYLRPLSCNK